MEATRNRLALTLGVKTFLVPRVDDTDRMIEQVDHVVLRIPGYQPGDTVVIVAGEPERVHRHQP